jgi:hypothetical protein
MVALVASACDERATVSLELPRVRRLALATTLGEPRWVALFRQEGDGVTVETGKATIRVELADGAIEQAAAPLRKALQSPALWDAQGASRVGVILRADARTPWQTVERFLEICSFPDVRIHRIGFAVDSAKTEKVFPIRLPWERTRGKAVARPDDVLVVKLSRSAQGTFEVRVGDVKPVTLRLEDDTWWDGLARSLPPKSAKAEIAVEKSAADKPGSYGLLIRAWDALVAAGVAEVHLAGFAPWRPAVEETELSVSEEK